MKQGKKRTKMGPWPRLQKFWDIRAACNFIGGGTGSSLLMIAALYALLDQTNLTPIIAGVICISFGLLMVFWEIGRPWRSINMFFHPQTSWMTREGILVMPLFLCAGFLVVYTDHQLARTIAVLMGIFAVVFLYCQVRILHAAKGIPAWHHPNLKPYIFSSGLTEALGIAVCLPGLMTESPLMIALGVMLLLRLIFWQAYTKNLERDGAPEVSCAVFEAIQMKLVLSHVLSLVFLMIAWFTNMVLFSILAGVLAATTGWYVKVIIVTRAAQTRGFAIPRTPVRGQGQSRLLGRQR